MTVYARSDVVGVGVPADAGGCGQFHRRPVIDGAPVKLFAVQCPACEPYLLTRLKDHWTVNRWEIPLTEDEQRQAEMLEEQARRIARDMESQRHHELVQGLASSANSLVGPEPDPVGPAPVEPPPPVASSEAIAREDAEQDLHALTVSQLRTLCRERGVAQAGSKADLIGRLEAASA